MRNIQAFKFPIALNSNKRFPMLLKGASNYIGLQVGWLACVWGAANDMFWFGPLLVSLHLGIHLFWSDSRRREVIFISVVTLFGLMVDSLQKVTGLVEYNADFPTLPWLAPIWIIAMWSLFATSLNTSLKWLNRSYALAALLGIIFGPLNYRAGVALGAASFPLQDWITFGSLAVIWGITLPLLIWINRKLTYFES